MEEKRSKKNNDSVEDIAVWIGLDWATEEHKICNYEVATEKIESSSIKHSAESLHQWLDELRKQYGGAKVAVVLEQSRGAVLYALMNYDFVVLYPVNPESLSSYRNAFYTSGALKDFWVFVND